MIDDFRKVKEWEERATLPEEQALYVVMTHVLKNISRPLLQQWWKVEVMSRLVIFLSHVNNTLRCLRVCFDFFILSVKPFLLVLVGTFDTS
jgi:hypothetical protein